MVGWGGGEGGVAAGAATGVDGGRVGGVGAGAAAGAAWKPGGGGGNEVSFIGAAPLAVGAPTEGFGGSAERIFKIGSLYIGAIVGIRGSFGVGGGVGASSRGRIFPAAMNSLSSLSASSRAARCSASSVLFSFSVPAGTSLFFSASLSLRSTSAPFSGTSSAGFFGGSSTISTTSASKTSGLGGFTAFLVGGRGVLAGLRARVALETGAATPLVWGIFFTPSLGAAPAGAMVITPAGRPGLSYSISGASGNSSSPGTTSKSRVVVVYGPMRVSPLARSNLSG